MSPPDTSARPRSDDIRRLVTERRRALELNVYCHVPGEGRIDLTALAHGGDETDRWSRADQPTVYLASDPGVVLAELGRHQRGGRGEAVKRRILRLRLAEVDVVDLRDASVAGALGVDDVPRAYLDRAFARRIGCAVRETGACSGIIVPSMALLDDDERHCVVLFDEAIDGGFAAAVAECVEVGEVRTDG